MQAQEWWTVVAAVTAVCSLLLCGLLARRMIGLSSEVRALRDEPASDPTDAVGTPARPGPPAPTVAVVTTLRERLDDDRLPPSDDDTPASAGVVLLPTQEEVTRATLGRPLVRSAVVGHGLWHALRPESRDRIRGIVRREFRRRKRDRLAAGRRAARAAPVDRTQAQAWLGSATPPRQASVSRSER